MAVNYYSSLNKVYKNYFMAMYDNDNTVTTSFDSAYLSEYLLQAQWAEFIELKKVIHQLAEKKRAPVSILDIGIGNARVLKHLFGIKDIWNMIELYHGTDNAQSCVDISNNVIQDLEIQHQASAIFLDAINLGQLNRTYDLIITTWFTAGNFYPETFSFETCETDGNRLNLDRNEKFETIFLQAYNLLNAGGEIVLGACYIDNDATRLKQEASYKKMQMTIITDSQDSFTATKEGFWSQRFTKEKLFRYLNFAAPEKISITPLDTYEYAMQVRIGK